MGDENQDLVFRLSRELAALIEINYSPGSIQQVLPEAVEALRDAKTVLKETPDSVEIVLSCCGLS